MNEFVNIIPQGIPIEEAIGFDLAAGATRDGPPIDTEDWSGSLQADFTAARASGFPWLDLFIRAPGSVQVILQIGRNTGTIAAPALTYHDGPSWAFLGGQVGLIEGYRLASRFSRVRVLDTSGAPNNGIYLVYFVRGV